MGGPARLGVPENGRAALTNTAAAFETYAQLLVSHADEFDAQVLSASSIERFETVIREIAAALADEARSLRRRAELQIAALPSAGGFDIHEVVDEVLGISTGPAASALGSERGGARGGQPT